MSFFNILSNVSELKYGMQNDLFIMQEKFWKKQSAVPIKCIRPIEGKSFLPSASSLSSCVSDP